MESEFRYADGKTPAECDVAHIEKIPVKHFVLKGGKELVDREFARLREWVDDQRATAGNSGRYLHNHESFYTLDLMLLPNCQKPSQSFTVLCDFERLTCQVEYHFPRSTRCGVPCGADSYVFDCMEQLDKTIVCWVRFREFISAIVE